ncbi:NAD(P)/FAD-dependent oxidoreductase [Nostoc cf. edaphicum LEGE 07299]|uniref:NAD(P)/FAD-dependent oxidoreductase n=1 Tax=Nostoc cf. edaphicum LEGE 07299 TaxID=2777974 RepID=A0ABR9TV11_9NOSO|nr:NAD(P)/FAD-dependent oxidoreductase [Nostoc edaphicum]MBE9104248.1 NAD(P)/FAD-dependent oxidoreductase [Nostoc cf. edaphicum LEGE 07299]
MTAKQICVIGAGVSGLVSAKTFLEEGYEVTLFEKRQGLGGVWERSRAYPGLSIQSPRDTYAFSDYPMPASYPEWPSGEQICAYLESYAHYFGVAQRIKLGAEVTKVEHKLGDTPGWIVSVSFQKNGKETRKEKYEFDFVIVCNGTFDIPYVPNLPGMEEFIASGGKVLHSDNFNDGSLMEGKRVVVVGFGKSAIDIANFAATKSKECTLVFRQPLWKIPQFFLGMVNMKYIFLTRFAEYWTPYHKLQGWEKWLHSFGKPLVWVFWRLNEILLRLQLPLDACDMVPKQPLNKFIGCSIGLMPKGFFEYVRKGKIRALKTKIDKFLPGGVELGTGEQVKADIVVFGTGFLQEIPFLEEKYRRYVSDEQGTIHLYRHLIHPHIPQMGFVGYNHTFCAQLSSEIGARWLSEYFKGNLNLPSPEQMLGDVKAQLAWKQKERPYGFLSGACLIPFTFHYIDELLEDMDLNTRRKPGNLLGELMMPADPSAYKNLRQELQAKQQPSLNDSAIAASLEVRSVS